MVGSVYLKIKNNKEATSEKNFFIIIFMKRKNIFFFISIFILGIGLGFLSAQKIKQKTPKKSKQNIYIRFTGEVWDTIQKNYWKKIDEDRLANLYVDAVEKTLSQPQPQAFKIKNKKGVLSLLQKKLARLPSTQQKKWFVTSLANNVLINLQPTGRSRLYTKKEAKNLKNMVKNINPNENEYKILGVPKTAKGKTIVKSYKKIASQLKDKAKTSTKAAQQLKRVDKAYQILADKETRHRYDKSGIESTISWRFITPDIFYMNWTRFSPTSFADLKKASEKSQKYPHASTLILDLRENIGGTIDGLPWFLGPFIGPNRYAYQFFHQGKKNDYKTRMGWLPNLTKFKKVVILVGPNTQSTAEIFTATLKKYNAGVVVGTKTKGWGTIEKVFPIKTQLNKNEKYSVFLVHSLTLDENGEPIQGRGINPDISVSSPGWENQLLKYFNYPGLVKTIKGLTLFRNAP